MTALPPAETVMHLVWAACGVVAPNSACIWPSCNCLIGVQRNDTLASLIAAAMAEEREAIAKLADSIERHLRASAVLTASATDGIAFGHQAAGALSVLEAIR